MPPPCIRWIPTPSLRRSSRSSQPRISVNPRRRPPPSCQPSKRQRPRRNPQQPNHQSNRNVRAGSQTTRGPAILCVPARLPALLRGSCHSAGAASCARPTGKITAHSSEFLAADLHQHSVVPCCIRTYRRCGRTTTTTSRGPCDLVRSFSSAVGLEHLPFGS